MATAKASGTKRKKDENPNLMTKDDSENYQYLEKYFKLERVEQGKKFRNLYFACQSCKPKIKIISAQENSMSNLHRHFENVHETILSDFDKVYYAKNKKKADTVSNQSQNNEQRSIFFRSNCSQAQLNDVIVDHVVSSMRNFRYPVSSLRYPVSSIRFRVSSIQYPV